MIWKKNVQTVLETIYAEFDKNGLFHDSTHHRLFHELTSCYCDKSFFTKGMIKCMYLASWDEEHFEVLLSQLMQMNFTNQSEGLTDMAENGNLMAEECSMFDNSTDATIYKLSCSFIEDEPFDSTSLPEDLTEHGKTVISCGVKAGAIIDEVIDE